MEPAPRFRLFVQLACLGAPLLLPSSAFASPRLVTPLPSATSAPYQSETPRRSLEDLLREVRAERGLSASSLQPEVVRLIDEIDALKSSRTGPMSRAKGEELAKLGPAALPLLVPFLEPGENVNRQTVFRINLVAGVLRDAPSATTTDALLTMAAEGSPLARVAALESLRTTLEPRRVAPAVIEIAAGKKNGDLKPDARLTVSHAAFSTLAVLDDPRASRFIGESLKSPNESLCAGALAALAVAPTESSAVQVLDLLEGLENAKPVASAIADYYEQHEELLEDPEHARALGGVAIHPTTPNEPRVRMFDALRLSDAKIGTVIKRDVEPFQEASRPDVRQAARLLMARLKDRGARQDLLGELDARIKRDKKSISAHSDRATVLHAIGDWNGALRDWRAVMTEMANDEIARARKEPYIGIARALARLKKFREASSYLSQGPISVAELQELGKDRDFAEMRDSRYGDVFQFGD